MTKLVFLATIILGLALRSVDCTTTLTATPTTVTSSLTPLRVRCDFGFTGPNEFDSLVSLRLTKEDSAGTSQDVASVTTFKPNNINTAPGFTGTTSAQIFSTGSSSYLEADYPNPTQNEAGKYQCTARGVDSFGRPLVQTSSATVTYSGGNQGDLQNQVNQLNSQLQQCRSTQSLQQTQLNQCQTQRTQDASKLTQAQNLARKLAQNAAQTDSQIISVSEPFNSDTVYMITDPSLSLTQAQAACARHGGYIVEINDEQEYQFVSRLLQNPNSNLPNNVNAFITGARYNDPSQPFQFLTNTGNPVYTGHWFPGEPDRLGPPNTYLLIYNINGQLGTADGPASGDTRTFVCEVKGN